MSAKPPPARRASYREAVGFGGLSFLSLALLGLGTGVLIARLYGVSAIGEFGLVMAAVNAAWFLSSAKERPALVRELARLEPRDPRATGLAAAVFAFSFVLTAVVAALAVGACWLAFNGPIDRPDLFAPAAASLAAYALLTNSCFNLDTILASYRAGRQLFWVRLLQALAFTALAVAADVAFHPGVWGLVLAQTGSAFTGLVHRIVVLRPFIRWRVPRAALREGFRTLPDVIRFGLKIAPGGVADGIAVDSATWVLGATGTTALVGAYNRAYLLGRRLMDLNWRVNEVLFPTLVERRANGDRPGFDRALVDSLRYVTGLMLLPAAAAGGAAHGVMELFGPGFDRGAGALALLLLLPPLATCSNILRHVLYVAGRPWLGTASGCLRMVVTLAAIVPLARALGSTGAALAVVAGIAVDTIFAGGFARAELHRPLLALWPARQLVAVVLAYVAGFGAARGVDELIATLPGVVPALAAGALAYAAVLVAVGGVGERDRERLAALAATIRARGARPAAAGVS